MIKAKPNKELKVEQRTYKKQKEVELVRLYSTCSSPVR